MDWSVIKNGDVPVLWIFWFLSIDAGIFYMSAGFTAELFQTYQDTILCRGKLYDYNIILHSTGKIMFDEKI